MDVKTALKEIERSAKHVQIEGKGTVRIVFEDERCWKWFGEETQILEPFNDYTYRWVLAALQSINYHLSEHDDLEAYDPRDDIDAVVDVYTSQLTAWLNDRPANIAYMTEVLMEWLPKDGFQLLSWAQSLAIEEVFVAVMAKVRKLLS